MTVIDFSSQLNAVEREVAVDHRDGKEMRIVTLRQTYATTAEDLWAACTTAERLPRWFLPISGDLQLGGTYQFEGNAGGEILACDAPHRVAVTWVFAEAVSWVELRLRETETDREVETRLELEHVMEVSDFWTQYGPGAVGVGWESGMLGLALHLTQGGDISPADAQAAMMTPEGLAFMRESAAAWAEASVAGGEDAAWAHAAANRTAGFYTGVPVED